MLIDSHCHLNFPDFKYDLDAVIARARAAGVGIMQTICTEMAEFEAVYAIAKKYEDIYCSVGVHPNNKAEQEKIVTFQELIEKTARPKVIGIGETGLDYHYENTDKNWQKLSLIEHIKDARATGLPLIIHTRDAEADTLELITYELSKGYFKFLIHCFTASKEFASAVIELGGYISMSGIISFKSASAIRGAIEGVPLDRLLIETDSPYLAPTPHRGKRNEPEFVSIVNKTLAEIKKIDEKECAKITSDNFFRLFDKVKTE